MRDRSLFALHEFLTHLVAQPVLMPIFTPLLRDNRKQLRAEHADHRLDHTDVQPCAECDAMGIGATPLCDHAPSCSTCRLFVQIDSILQGL